MKTYLYLIILCCLSLLLSTTISAQSPQSFPYQAVARDVNGNLLSNQLIALRFTILDNSNAGPVTYQEIQNVTTNALGLFSVNIGQGNVITGSFNSINWAINAKFLKVELDAGGGSNYTTMGTTQLMSVPYALYANGTLANGSAVGNTPYWNGTSWITSNNNLYNNGGNIGIGTSTPTAKLHTTGSVRHQGLSGVGARQVMTDENGNLFTPVPPMTSTPNTAIPDNNCASGVSLNSSITLSGLPTAVSSSSIMVRVNITHTYDADLAIFLVAPNGATIRLIQNNGSNGDHFSNTLFSDNATGNVTSGVAPFAGMYKPMGTLTSYCTVTPTINTFSAIGGGSINPNGVWTLKIFDDAASDVGVLHNWSVEIQGYTNGGTSNYVPKWENGVLSNTSNVYDDGAHVGIGTNTPTAQFHTTGTVRHEILEGTGNRLLYADSDGFLKTHSAPNFNSISSSVIQGGNTCNSNSITVAGMPSSVESGGITIRMNVTHPAIQNIDMYLEAPNGQKLNLTDGSYASGADMLNTAFTDQVLLPLTSSANPPHSGTFRPLGGNLINACLSTNLLSFGSFGGGSINPNGVWKLWVRDSGPFGPQGMITNWNISFGDTTNNGFANYIPKWTSNGLKNSSLLYEDGSHVGIGTTYPTNKLSVSGDGNFTGYLGVGVTNPEAPLHVSGLAIGAPSQARAYFSAGSGNSIVTNTSASNSIMIRADGWMWANGGGFVATSDKRIKHILSITNNQQDLAVLNKINITNYKYIDEIRQGNRLQKKVIAQQIDSIYPIAVNVSEGIIPNVFEKALQSEIRNGKTYIETSKQHQFKTGDEVKLLLARQGEKVLAVMVINEHLFTINEQIDDEIFVYGKKVNDLLTVDYDALTTLNISATQALSKEIEFLKQENKLLKKESQDKTNQLMSNNQQTLLKVLELESKLNELMKRNLATAHE